MSKAGVHPLLKLSNSCGRLFYFGYAVKTSSEAIELLLTLLNRTEMGDNQYIQMYIGDDVSVAPKKRPPRRNPWGNSSYADLITQAIETSPEKKLTLSQIYDWMIRNIPHFSNQGASNSSAGWKNSIRHNLSLHEKFLRVKNEDTNCKSSWWTVNKSGGTGRTTRRKNLSRRKKIKSIPTPQKANAFFRKFSLLSSTNQTLSSSNFDSNLQTISNSSKKRWQSCSSNSSEENESFQSLSASNSPSSIEGEIHYRDAFGFSHSTYTTFSANQPLHGFPREFSSSTTNAYLHVNSDIYNYTQLNSNAIETYYSLGNKFYSRYNNQQNPSSESYINIPADEESSSSTISREYFKSPHHLSGSYMTSEFAKVDRIQNSIRDCEKPNVTSTGVTNLESHIIQRSSALKERFNLNQNALLTSNEDPILIHLPLVSQNSEELNESVNLDSLNQQNLRSADVADNLNASHIKKEGEEECERENEYSGSHLQYHQSTESTHKLKLNIHVKEELDASSFREITSSHYQETVHNVHENCLEENSKEAGNQVLPISQLTSTANEKTSDFLSTHSVNSIRENLDIRKNNQSLKRITTKEDNSIEHAENSISLDSRNNEVENGDWSCIPDDYNSLPQEIYSTPNYFQNERYFPNDSAETGLELNLKSDSLVRAELQENSDSSSETTMSQTGKAMDKRKTEDGSSLSHHITLPSPKRQKMEATDIKFTNTDEVSSILEVSSKKRPRMNASDIKDEVNRKVIDLLSDMLHLILHKVGHATYAKHMVDYTLSTLSYLSGLLTSKQLLATLVEFSYALDSTYMYQTIDMQLFHSYNRSMEKILNDDYKICSSLKEVIDLYFRVISAAISESFSEKVLSDSRIKDMDFPPDINLFLQMYQIDAISEMINGNKLKNLSVYKSEKEYKFVLPSVSSGMRNKSLNCDLNIVDDQDDINISYESCYNHELYEPIIPYDQHTNPRIPQKFLDALQLQRTVRASNSVANDDSELKTQGNTGEEIPECYFDQTLSVSGSKDSYASSSLQQNIIQHLSDPLQIQQEIMGNFSVINDGHQENMAVNNSLEEYKPTNCHIQINTLSEDNDVKLGDILPEDLRDIEITSNFSLTSDYIDFEFHKNDFDFDEHAKESGVNVKN